MQSGDVDQIVFKARVGKVTDAPVRAAVVPMLAAIARLPHVAGVTSPYDPSAGRRVSADGSIGFATVLFDERANVLPVSAIQAVIGRAEQARSTGLQVDLGGQAIAQTQFAAPSTTTKIGILAAIRRAAPQLRVVPRDGAADRDRALRARHRHRADRARHARARDAELRARARGEIGLGVGIDYALFILSRFREIDRENGGDVEQAVALAMDTAGRAVLFAGATVVIALLGMLALGVSFLYGFAVAASLAVLLVLAASITLLPALLTFFGRRVGAPGRLARLFARKREPSLRRPGFWARWIGAIQRHPAVAAIAATVLMLPAMLELLGERAWAFPDWLDRRLPRLAIENDGPVPHAPPARPALDGA